MYVVIGVMAVFNLGTIVSVLYYGARAVWFMGQLEHRVVVAEKDIGNAFTAIRKIEERT